MNDQQSAEQWREFQAVGEEQTLRCPNCGSDDFITWAYDFGQCSKTGYRDEGVRAECNKCHHDADIEDFQP